MNTLRCKCGGAVTIDSGKQRHALQPITIVDQVVAGATVDGELIDGVVASNDAAADDVDDATTATTQGSGIVYQNRCVT